jgi:hypothetical protein
MEAIADSLVKDRDEIIAILGGITSARVKYVLEKELKTIEQEILLVINSIPDFLETLDNLFV